MLQKNETVVSKVALESVQKIIDNYNVDVNEKAQKNVEKLIEKIDNLKDDLKAKQDGNH